MQNMHLETISLDKEMMDMLSMKIENFKNFYLLRLNKSSVLED